jgi:putative ABC transport system permease protein
VKKLYVPFRSMARDFPNRPPSPPHTIDRILVQPKSLAGHLACKLQLTKALARIHGFDPRDEEALNVWDTVEEVKQFRLLTDGMRYFLGGVGITTLLLGGIGVMNVMLVAVRERTREIGIRKAVGATARSIVLQIFCETILIVLMSGLFGGLAAVGFCAAVNSLPMPPFFAGLLLDWRVAGGSLGLLGFLALAAALYPSMQAARIDPIEALRFEGGG